MGMGMGMGVVATDRMAARRHTSAGVGVMSSQSSRGGPGVDSATNSKSNAADCSMVREAVDSMDWPRLQLAASQTGQLLAQVPPGGMLCFTCFLASPHLPTDADAHRTVCRPRLCCGRSYSDCTLYFILSFLSLRKVSWLMPKYPLRSAARIGSRQRPRYGQRPST